MIQRNQDQANILYSKESWNWWVVLRDPKDWKCKPTSELDRLRIANENWRIGYG